MENPECAQIMSAISGTLRRFLFFGRFITCFFFKWDKNTKQIVIYTSRIRHKMVQLCSILHLLVAVCQTYYVTMSKNGVFDRTMIATCCSTSWIFFLARFELKPNLIPIIRMNKLLTRSWKTQGLIKYQISTITK